MYILILQKLQLLNTQFPSLSTAAIPYHQSDFPLLSGGKQGRKLRAGALTLSPAPIYIQKVCVTAHQHPHLLLSSFQSFWISSAFVLVPSSSAFPFVFLFSLEPSEPSPETPSFPSVSF